VVGLAASRLIINVPFTDPRLQCLHIAAHNGDVLEVAFDAGLFHSDWSGTIEYRFRTLQAQAFWGMLAARM